MPVNQPPIKDDPTESAWDLEITQAVNRLENQVVQLQAPEDPITTDSIGAIARTEFNGRTPVRILSGTDMTSRLDPGSLASQQVLTINHNFGHTNYAVLYNIVHGTTATLIELTRVITVEKTINSSVLYVNDTVQSTSGGLVLNLNPTAENNIVTIDWAIISYE